MFTRGLFIILFSFFIGAKFLPVYLTMLFHYSNKNWTTCSYIFLHHVRVFFYNPYWYVKSKFSFQLDYSFNRSSLWSRFVSSSFINMTEIKHGIQVSGLVNVKEDYYNVFNATQLSRILIEYLQRWVFNRWTHLIML